MSEPQRAVCFHAHLYQPPREDPWLGVVEPESTAAPARDWNTRITQECYAPLAAARVLDARGWLLDVMNLYGTIGFNVGPTLLEWLVQHAPGVAMAMVRADVESRQRVGHGAAWAQPWSHPILPLSTPRDAATQVRWGVREFELRFGRRPEGMWLPEMAVDVPSLVALADAGITLTMLAPHQARRVRPLGAGDDAWRPIGPEGPDPRRVYRCALPAGRTIDVVFRHAALSNEVGFGQALADGARLARRVRQALGEGEGLVTVAVDGETYGHHHRFGEMALAFALRELQADAGVALLPLAAYRERRPAADEIEVVPETSWSCIHGIERWRSSCSCRTGGPAGWNQAWRGPLRLAIDWLRDELAVLYETRAAEVLRDPWGARDRYVDVVLEPGRLPGFLAAEASERLSPGMAVHARRSLELARHALLMQTSCGWFFDDLAGVEALLVLRHAARAIELAEMLGRRLEDGFLARFEPARSNRSGEGGGAELWRRRVRSARATPARVAATAAMLALVGQQPRVPGYEITFSAPPEQDRLEVEARVVEEATGASLSVQVTAERTSDGAPGCRVGDTLYGLADLFGVQREQLLAAVAEATVQGASAGRAAALAAERGVLAPLLTAASPVPGPLAQLLGAEEGDAIARALESDDGAVADLQARIRRLRERGIALPEALLAPRLLRRLLHAVAGLPDSAGEVHALLDLAECAGLRLDCTDVQRRAFEQLRSAAADSPELTRLRQRLELASER